MLNCLAQLSAPPTTGGAAPGWAEQLRSPMTLMIMMVIVMYIFIFRGNKSKDKERKTMLDKLTKGDRIQTIGGILGTVIEAREADVLVKVDESNNTKIRFSRSAIHRVLEDGKAFDTPN
ncbi:hypothetical protein BH10PLA1_BH10PLA1_07420 [soil metagenome]